MVVDFHDLEDYLINLEFVVIQARYNGNWIFVRHKNRTSWEIPGGHIEFNETIIEAARRELWEESGAIDFELKPICNYSVQKDGIKSYGRLYYADVKVLGKLPDHEIVQIKFGKELPTNLTYEEIQPYLFKKVMQEVDNI